ncbi:ribbon-helix-helix domain-containing protein [Methylobacterium nigriterrae]|uniref:ribbon-helix-helix domain-containing protein n=1 Tax=Methylobacterium nigriterrae TaxID=3127512 RepID=UPI00301326C0
MSKPPKLSLASIVAAASPAKPAPARPAALQGPPTAEIVQLDLAPVPARRPSATLKQRARQMSVYLEPPVYDQLRDLAYAERTKMHALMLEALDLLFKQRGAKSIEQLNEADPR